MQKARRHSLKLLRPLVGRRVQGLFHSPIGLSGVFSLTGWAPLIRAEFLVLRVTQDTTRLRQGVVYRAFTVSGSTFQLIPLPCLLATAWSYYPGIA